MITIVTTAEELQAAVIAGAAHIEIQAHLNLTTLELADLCCNILDNVPATVKSIRGNCGGVPPPSPSLPPSHAPLRPLLRNQCLLLTDFNLMRVLGSQIWLDGLYLRLTTPRKGLNNVKFNQFIHVRNNGTQLWLTRMTFQGNGDGTRTCQPCGLGLHNQTAVYAEDCTFADFGGYKTAYLRYGGTLSMVRCSFVDNTIFPKTFPTDPGAAVIVASPEADLHTASGDVYHHGDAQVRLENCAFNGNAPSTIPTLLADNRNTSGRGLFYSDSSSPPQVCTIVGPDDTAPPPPCNFGGMRALVEADSGFLSTTSEWFVKVQQEHPLQTIGSSPRAPQSEGIVPGAVVAGVAVLLIAAACIAFLIHRPAQDTTHNAKENPTVQGAPVVKGVACVTTSTYQRTSMLPPDTNASKEEQKEWLEYQLDGMAGQELLDGLRFMKGPASRARGGQAVVQFATHYTKQEMAVKFFLSDDAFAAEVQQYLDVDSPLQQFLPECRDAIQRGDARLVDAQGHALPPCIVMEKGESLDRWVQRNIRAMDQFTCMQILHHVCECLIDLHDAGYVHRDVKPANVMWLPSQNRWTLIDFGCAARIGEEARASFTLAYAAPEAVSEFHWKKNATIVASPALDAWSVGMMALELFNGQPALVQLDDGNENVIARLVGTLKLPWEDEDIVRDLLKNAGRFKEPVLNLLHRDPEKRALVQTFVQQYAAIMSTTTQQQSPPCLPSTSHTASCIEPFYQASGTHMYTSADSTSFAFSLRPRHIFNPLEIKQRLADSKRIIGSLSEDTTCFNSPNSTTATSFYTPDHTEDVNASPRPSPPGDGGKNT